MTTWNEEVDVVVVGTGAAAFAGAISAADRGLSVLMIESTDKWGGSSSMSGGGMWLPNNRLMQRDGAGDNRDDALAYLDASITQAGDGGPGVTKERKEAFVDNVNNFVDLMEKHGASFARAKEYPDYYPELPGGKIGRAIETQPCDAKDIGEWWDTSRGQDGVAMPMMTDDVWLLARAWSTPAGFKRGASVVGRALLTVLKGQRAVGCGAALAVTFMKIFQNLGGKVWLNTPLTDLVEEGGRVVGVLAERDGIPVAIQARKGVILGSGGFAKNEEKRREHHGVGADWSSANPGNQGVPIDIAQRLGAAVGLMDDAWWGASIPSPDGEHNPSFLVSERSMPYCIIVDDHGHRFANESESYVDLGHHMLEHRQKVGDTKFWMILDNRHVRRYLRTFAIIPGLHKALEEKGMFVKAETLTELTAKTGIDPAGLQATTERFNGMAKTGIDQDFGRGNSAYDRYYGDPLVHPNPNLGGIEKGPFYAYELVPGDLGTKGGVVTDDKARVLREDGTVIEGLYASGNCTASVMGRTYPGPGSTLGPAVVFGYIAGQQAAG